MEITGVITASWRKGENVASDDNQSDGWLDIGVDVASQLWSNWSALNESELRALGREQWTNPVAGHNTEIRRLEHRHPELRRKL
ncbi:hypothetical protein GCM10010489_11160 [Microbacterium saperdae]|nr:hypothetical protein GCM10010489_11160 [Microbacterium saperdae]